jgi:ferredoxin-NADP reductase
MDRTRPYKAEPTRTTDMELTMSATIRAAARAQVGIDSAQVRVTRVEPQAGGTVAVLALEPLDGEPLPAWAPGAHLDVVLPDGTERQYSLCGTGPERPWRLGVLREPESRGGSEYIHTSVKVGDLLTVRGPRNNFSLVEDSPEYVFVAGGIGITPFLPMIDEVERRGASWRLVYGGRSRASMAFLDELAKYGDRVTVYPQDEFGHIDVAGIVGQLVPGGVLYSCGPEPLLNAMEDATAHLPAGTLHLERFRPRQDVLNGERQPFEVYLDYSELTLQVSAHQSIVDALEQAGIDVLTSCREGTCGTCETPVLEGVPDHRDSYLSPAERESNETMMVCCSRARTPRLVLDL